MLRAIWSGSISFGLVAIPVKAVPAQSPRDVRFELLHRPCGGKMETRRYCPRCERDASEGEIARGYQYAKGRYVTLEPEDLETIDSPAKRTLQILDFVDLGSVDPVYFEKPYYLQPAPGGERTYALLHRAMVERGRVGIGKVAFREREHLALVRPVGHALVLETISFPDEVRSVEDAVQPLNVEIPERELQMAQMLVDQMSGAFEPDKYHDQYREALTRLIDTKVEGGEVTAAPAPPAESGSVADLMEMLRRSVAAAGGPEATEAPAGDEARGEQKTPPEDEANEHLPEKSTPTVDAEERIPLEDAAEVRRPTRVRAARTREPERKPARRRREPSERGK